MNRCEATKESIVSIYLGRFQLIGTILGSLLGMFQEVEVVGICFALTCVCIVCAITRSQSLRKGIYNALKIIYFLITFFIIQASINYIYEDDYEKATAGLLCVFIIHVCVFGLVFDYNFRRRNDRHVNDNSPLLNQTRTWSEPENEEVFCSICYVPYKPNDTLRVLSQCHHEGHIECVDRWVRSSNRCHLCNVNVV